MAWIRSHLPHARAPSELSPELRNASHRIANETMALQSEIILAVGGRENYRRESEKIRQVMAEMLRRT